MKILLLRDSVSYGDDMNAPNKGRIEVPELTTIVEILNKILEIKYLPEIWGGNATWSVSFTQPIAVIAQQWNEPKLICSKDYPYYKSNHYVPIDKIYFNYHSQIDPDLVFKVLSRYKHGQLM